MDHKPLAVIILVRYTIITKRYISDCNIKEIVRIFCLFIAFDLDLSIRI